MLLASSFDLTFRHAWLTSPVCNIRHSEQDGTVTVYVLYALCCLASRISASTRNPYVKPYSTYMPSNQYTFRNVLYSITEEMMPEAYVPAFQGVHRFDIVVRDEVTNHTSCAFHFRLQKQKPHKRRLGPVLRNRTSLMGCVLA